MRALLQLRQFSLQDNNKMPSNVGEWEMESIREREPIYRVEFSFSFLIGPEKNSLQSTAWLFAFTKLMRGPSKELMGKRSD